MTKALDDLDKKLIAELRRDGRATAVQLARRLGVPRTTIVGRMHALERDKVILGYTARINPKALGTPVKSYIMVSFTTVAGIDQRQVARNISRMPGVEEVDIVSGDWDMLIKVRVPNIEAIGDLVLDRIRKEPGVARTVSINSFGTVKEGP